VFCGAHNGLTPCSGVPRENLTVVQLIQKFIAFMKPEVSLPSSQDPILNINGLTERYRKRELPDGSQLIVLKITRRNSLCILYQNNEGADYTHPLTLFSRMIRNLGHIAEHPTDQRQASLL
jgi:hypothetical protein